MISIEEHTELLDIKRKYKLLKEQCDKNQSFQDEFFNYMNDKHPEAVSRFLDYVDSKKKG